ncbi:MAG: DUF411 domain-containing protein [Candidatus Yanofskybacteria bacterium]|nr:DUF411 domain-containing protein [Candidatus Yanofskybacteria bacterium]
MNTKSIIVGGAIATIAVAGLVSGVGRSGTGSERILEVPVVNATALSDPSCGCCGNHAAYLGNSGFSVDRQSVQDITATKQEYGIPHELMSCHTTLIESYVVEGHMPSVAIKKLLEEAPDIKGIALPGMPHGSPGMSGRKNETWTVYTIEHDGSSRVFMEL